MRSQTDYLSDMENLYGPPAVSNVIQTIGIEDYPNVRAEIVGTIRKELVTQMQSDLERKDLVRAFVYENDYAKTLEAVNENWDSDYAKLASFVTNIFPSVVVEQGSIDGTFSVYAETPTGTLTWMFRDAHRPTFIHLPVVEEYQVHTLNDAVMDGYTSLKNDVPVTSEDRLRQLLISR